MIVPAPAVVPTSYVWDASALHHFGKADRLDVLGTIVGGSNGSTWSHHITDIVVEELERHGLARPEWCELVSATELADITAFAAWTQLMSDGIHDLGEASTTAWAHSYDHIAIIDDLDAKSVARRNGGRVHGSAWLLCQCITHGLVDRASASSLVDAAIAAGARYPFAPRGFGRWAVAEKLLTT